MYCKNCGKQIENDSKFCRYCGTKLEDIYQGQNNRNKATIVGRFQALPFGRQISILCYGIFVLIWVAVLIGFVAGETEIRGIVWILFSFFLSVIVVPLIAYTVAYAIKQKKKQNMPNKSIDNTEAQKEIAVEKPKTPKIPIIPDIIKGIEIERYSLMEFAFLYGKMQIKRLTREDGNIETYCVFINNGVEKRVEFDSKLGILSAQEISERKLGLCVVKYDNDVFVLANKN